MKSKTSFCNGTAVRKDLSRFAPLWVLYLLCLLLGLALLYVDNENLFWFANNMGELIHNSAVINLIYAPLVAMLLFGDLYNSRMCNALHAMPLKRGCWFGSHVIAGLLFSIIPTAIFCVLAAPLLMNTCVVGGGWIALWAFLGMNLIYLCFFGIAVFSVFCAGNRFGMAAIYALLNGGAYIVYFLIDFIYTPMLYGVITPNQLVYNLTPMYHMTNFQYISTMNNLYQLRELFGEELKGAVATFAITEEWFRLWILAGVGFGFSLLGLVLYKLRHLECAGSAVAFPILRPVFEVLCAIFVAAAAQFFLYNFLGLA